MNRLKRFVSVRFCQFSETHEVPIWPIFCGGEVWGERAVAFANSNHSSASSAFDARAEQRVETLVTEISGVIRAAEPEKRAGLKDLAETLLHEEISTIVEESTPVAGQASQSRLNPLAFGLLFIILGLGFLLFFPPVGMTLAFIGAVLVVWGGAISWFKK